MTELHRLMEQATDRIENPRLEQIALQTARHRHTRRRGAAAAGLAAALVVTVIAGSHVGDSDIDPAPATPSNHTPVNESTGTPRSSERVWPEWDPRDVDQLPAAPDRIAPALPEVIDSPSSSPLLVDDPVDAAVLAVEHQGVAQVLGTDGAWRSVPINGRYPVLSLSPSGTRLAVYYSYDDREPEHDYRVTVHDLATGGSRELPTPPGFVPWNTGWDFIDEDSLLLESGPRSYVVQIESGDAKQTEIPTGIWKTFDPEGNLLVGADFSEPNVLTDLAGGRPRKVSMDRTGRLSRIQAAKDTVVGTTYDDRPYSVVVADRKTLTPQFRLPVHDHDGNYSNGGLRPIAIADDGTVLLRVAAIGRRVDGFRVVAWEPKSGALSIASSTALPVEASVVFARAMLRAVGPG